jgi:hypothetical protein
MSDDPISVGVYYIVSTSPEDALESLVHGHDGFMDMDHAIDVAREFAGETDEVKCVYSFDLFAPTDPDMLNLVYMTEPEPEPEPIAISWKDVFNSDLGHHGWMETARNEALHVGYEYFTWSGWVYRTLLRPDGAFDKVCLAEDLQ